MALAHSGHFALPSLGEGEKRLEDILMRAHSLDLGRRAGGEGELGGTRMRAPLSQFRERR